MHVEWDAQHVENFVHDPCCHDEALETQTDQPAVLSISKPHPVDL